MPEPTTRDEHVARAVELLAAVAEDEAELADSPYGWGLDPEDPEDRELINQNWTRLLGRMQVDASRAAAHATLAGLVEKQPAASWQTAPADVFAAIRHNVRILRTARGWTQEETGQRMTALTGRPWTNATWSAAERHNPNRPAYRWKADELVALAQIFGVGIDALLAPEAQS